MHDRSQIYQSREPSSPQASPARRPAGPESVIRSQDGRGHLHASTSDAGAAQPLTAHVAQRASTLFGHSFASVRVFSDEEAARRTAELGAHAYAVGESLVFGRGRFAPSDPDGRRLLGHELAHVVQQRIGGRSPESDPRSASEHEARLAGEAFAAGHRVSPIRHGTAAGIACDKGSKPMSAAHAGGAMGELDAAFALGEQGFEIIIGPAGSNGHKLTEAGLDIVAYNPLTDKLRIVDNKASGGTSTVKDASAITDNLKKNVRTAADKVKALPDFPNKAKVTAHLEATYDAVEKGKRLPGKVRLVVTNAGGYHSGVSKKLAAKGIAFEDMTGKAVRDARKKDVARAKAAGKRAGRPTTVPDAPETPTAPRRASRPAPAAAPKTTPAKTAPAPKKPTTPRSLGSVAKWGRVSPFDVAMLYLDLHAAHFEALSDVKKRAAVANNLLSRLDDLEKGARELSRAVAAQRRAEAELPIYPLQPDDETGQMAVTGEEMTYVELYYSAAARIANDAMSARAQLHRAIQGWDAILDQAKGTGDFTRKAIGEAVIVLDKRFSKEGSGFRAYLVDAFDRAGRAEAWARSKQYHAADILGKWTPEGYAPPSGPN